MQKKLSKHFIYTWLNEDSYGEYLLHKPFTNNFSKKLLLNVWKFMLRRKNVSRARPNTLTATFLPHFIDTSLSKLRSSFFHRCMREKNFFFKPTQLTTNLQLFININKNFIISRLIPILLKKKFKSTLLLKFNRKFWFVNSSRKGRVFFIKKNILHFDKNEVSKKIRWSRYPFKLKRKRRRWVTRRYKRKLSVSIFSKKINPYKRRKILQLKLIKKNKFAKKNYIRFNKKSRYQNIQYKFNRRKWKTSIFLNKGKKRYFYKNFRKRTKRFFKQILRFQNISKVYWRKLGSNLKFAIKKFKKRKISKFISWRFNFFSNRSNNSLTQLKSAGLMRHRQTVTKQLFYKAWDWLAYRLKVKTYRIIGKKRSGTYNKTFVPRFTFKGVFKKRKRIIRKHEKRPLLKFRMLNYFNLVTTAGDYIKLQPFKNYITAKSFRLPMLSYLEFQISSLLLRSNFFENGYVVNSLIRRNVFLVNGGLVSAPMATRVWDIITIQKPLWWLVYARFINFFFIFLKRKTLTSSLFSHHLPSIFLRKALRTRPLLRKIRGTRRLKPMVRRIIYSKNYIFSKPPSYMEVSYKLFMIILCKFITRSRDLTSSPTLRGLKKLVSTRYNRPTRGLKLV